MNARTSQSNNSTARLLEFFIVGSVVSMTREQATQLQEREKSAEEFKKSVHKQNKNEWMKFTQKSQKHPDHSHHAPIIHQPKTTRGRRSI